MENFNLQVQPIIFADWYQMQRANIADLLDFGSSIGVGCELVFDRQHKFFFSPLDLAYFVAVQDK